MEEARKFLGIILSVQPRIAAAGGGKRPEASWPKVASEKLLVLESLLARKPQRVTYTDTYTARPYLFKAKSGPMVVPSSCNIHTLHTYLHTYIQKRSDVFLPLLTYTYTQDLFRSSTYASRDVYHPCEHPDIKRSLRRKQISIWAMCPFAVRKTQPCRPRSRGASLQSLIS